MAANMAKDDLLLLERVFLRIGSTESDEQLEAVLAKFLTPVLLKLSGEQEVRMKVMELLIHVNKRVKSRPVLQLPVQDLIFQFQDATASKFTTNFTMVYIKLGFPRLPPDKQTELIPGLIKCLEGRSQAQQDGLMHLVIRAFQHIKLPKNSEKKKEYFGLEEKPHLKKLLLAYMLDMLLFPYSLNPKPAPEPPQQPQPSGSGPIDPTRTTGATIINPPGPHPGLSEYAYKRIMGDNTQENPLIPDDIEKIKIGILTILVSGVFNTDDILPHLVVAMADSRHKVATSADTELKRKAGPDDWNKSSVVSKLYSIFQGTIVIKGKTAEVKADHKRSPANVQLRMKIFPHLIKSREAPSQFPACVQIVFDCLYGGCTNQKLKIMAVQFVHHMCLQCPDNKFNAIGAVLLSGMLRLTSEAKEDARLRSLAYVAVGKIAKRVPKLVANDIALLQTFFDAVSKEESENKLAVQEALSMMSEAFRQVDATNLSLIEALIMQNIEKPESQARLMAVQYAKTVFPVSHILSRYVLLLACGDLKEEVFLEASRALSVTGSKSDDDENGTVGEEKMETSESSRTLMPAFPDMVLYVHEKATERVKSQNKYVIGNNVLAFNPGTYSQILMYLRTCLAYSAGVIPDIESTSAMQAQAPAISRYMETLLAGQTGDKSPISIYMGIIRQLLTAIGGAPAIYCLLEIIAVARERLASQFVKHLPWIKNFVSNSKEEMRMFAAQLYALIVAAAEPVNRHIEVLQDLNNNFKAQIFELQHGNMIVMGYLVSHLLGKKHTRCGDVTMEDVEPAGPSNKKLTSLISKTVRQIASQLDNSNALLSGDACVMIGEIGRRAELPLTNESTDEKLTTKLSVVKTLLAKVKSTKENEKVREKAALSLGYLCVGDKKFPHRRIILEEMPEAAQAKQFELHFIIGDALVTAAKGPDSPLGRDLWTETEQDVKSSLSEESTAEVGFLLELLLSKYARHANPHIRQAACVWLLCVTKECSEYTCVQSRLETIQGAFMSLLNESDELTQDIASKGLGLVYDKCSQEQKNGLVTILVDTLTAGRRAVPKVTADSQVFDSGTLGTTPDGQNISTYRELCSIANDLNQPDLIYKFMHLANHNAMWNSKKGAAFGFGTIAAQAGEQLAPFLHQIIPRLYRYQFDPNPKIQQTMASIWTTIVPKTKETVDKYMTEILNDLLKNLTSNQWRVRESSCMALNDLLRGRPLDDVIDLLPDLWEAVFRVRDDIKESVRKAAEYACKQLSRVCIKTCDPNYGKVGGHAIRVVLPCLLQVGLGSAVTEVRTLSLNTIMKISRNAGPLLKPHVALLVFALLESLSTLEPQYLNYLSLHATNMGAETQEKLDNARIAAIKTSPMMEVVNMCVQYVDETNLPELVQRLNELLKSGIGLGTKAGCASFIISLCFQCPRDLTPHAGKMLGSLLHGLSDRNLTVKKTYAGAIGHLVKVAKDSSVEKLILRLKEWYLDKEDDSVRHAVGLTLQAMVQRNPDIMQRHGANALPLAYFAMHEAPQDEAEKNKPDGSMSVWEEVWSEGTPGTEAGVQLYLAELVDLAKEGLGHQSWPRKAQAADTMRDVASRLGPKLGPPHLGKLLSALLDGLAGRTWTGKGTLLQAIKSVCVSCKDAIMETSDENQPSIDKVIDAIMKECKKENMKYKLASLECMADILETFNVDRYAEFSSLILPILEKKKESKEEDDSDIGRDTWLEFEACAYQSLSQSWPTNPGTQAEHQEALVQVIVSSLNKSFWKVDLALLKCTNKMLQRLCILSDRSTIDSNAELVTNMILPILSLLITSMGNLKYGSIRTEALAVVHTLIQRLSDCERLSVIPAETKKKKVPTATLR